MLTAYRGSWINHHGIVTIPCSYRGENSNASFYVTDTLGPAILGLPTSTDLNLLKFNCTIQTQHLHTGGDAGAQTISNSPDQPKKPPPFKDKQDLIAQYPECFNGIGKFQGEYHIPASHQWSIHHKWEVEAVSGSQGPQCSHSKRHHPYPIRDTSKVDRGYSFLYCRCKMWVLECCS